MNEREASMRRHPSARRRTIDRDTAYLIFEAGFIIGYGAPHTTDVTGLSTVQRYHLAEAVARQVLDSPLLRGEFEADLARQGITLTCGGAA